jgi:hypothetical protein
MQELESYAQNIAQVAECQEGSLVNCVSKSSQLEPQHPFARRPTVIHGAEANEIIESTIIPDMPGAKLNASLLKDRAPVILMQGPPLGAVKLRKLNKQFFGNIGWNEAYHNLGWCMVHDSCLIVWKDERRGAYILHCLSLSHHQFPCVALSKEESQSSINTILSSFTYVIGRSGSTIQNGVKLRGVLRGSLVNQAGSVVKGEMGIEGWVHERIPLRDGREPTYSYYQLKKNVDPASFMPICAKHIVAMNTLEKLFCPGANEARWAQSKHLGGIYPDMGQLGAGTGFTGTAGYACEFHLDSSTRGTCETILFCDPPDLPSGHKWIFALADAGVLLNLHNSPTFIMLPGQDVLHGTMYTGKGTGEDHIEHRAGGSALMNKRRMTGDASKSYERFHLASSCQDRCVETAEEIQGDEKIP